MAAPAERTTQTMLLNMGPQHPSTHGVLRLILELDGETVVDAKPDIGFLHTGMEKTCQSLKYYQATTITDRMDYLSPMSNNLAYILSVERLMGVEPPERAQVIRVLLCELQRIASHLVWLASTALELGAMSVFLYCFREREHIMDMFDEVAGSRLTPSYMWVGGVLYDITDRFLEMAKQFLDILPVKLDDYHRLLTRNPIWMARCQGVGYLHPNDALSHGVTGPMLRASGVDYDVRKRHPYCGYETYEFDVPVRTEGDAYARYLCRMEEMRQSRRICLQAIQRLEQMKGGPWLADDRRSRLPSRTQVYQDMHAMIHEFMIISEGFRPPPGEAYVPVESPRGEIGFYVVSDGSAQPLRVRVRPPTFYNTFAIPLIVRGHILADVISAVASVDVVLGEVDR